MLGFFSLNLFILFINKYFSIKLGVSADDPEIIQTELNTTTPAPKTDSPIKQEVLCIDQFFLNNCRIKRMPNLMHTCINKLDLSYNLLNDSIHLYLSKYTVYYMDYLNLQANNITYMRVITSEQQYKQEKYSIKNSPMNYFYGKVNHTALEHTVIDVRQNKHFRCDCSLVRLLSDYQSIRISSEKCNAFTNNSENLRLLDMECRKLSNSTANRGGAASANTLNRRLKALFVLTCILLVMFSLVIIYYTCSDCLTNFHHSIQRVFYRLFSLNGKLSSRLSAGMPGAGSSHSGGGIYNINNIGVQYSKLVEEATASQIELNT
jgi:hypothetical protein